MNQVRIHRKKLKTVLTQTGLLMEGLDRLNCDFLDYFWITSGWPTTRESSRGGSYQVASLVQQSRDFQLAADIRLAQRSRRSTLPAAHLSNLGVICGALYRAGRSTFRSLALRSLFRRAT